MVDEANDRILTSLDLLFQHRELFDDLGDGLFQDCRADPLRILYKYLDYVVLHMMEEIQANSDRKDAFIRCRLEWINIVLAAMDLLSIPSFTRGGKGTGTSGGDWSVVRRMRVRLGLYLGTGLTKVR